MQLLVELATGTGKTCTAAPFIERVFQANAVRRGLLPADRIPRARRAEGAVADHLPGYPAFPLHAGVRLQEEKRITIATLQSMEPVFVIGQRAGVHRKHYRHHAPLPDSRGTGPVD